VLSNISLQHKWNRLYARHQRGVLSVDEQLNLLLQTGVDAFGMEIGVISHIQHKTYTILYSTVPQSVCMQYSLNKTYCQITLKHQDILAIPHASDSGYANHPSLARFGVEAYFGMPLVVNGRCFGTIAFIKSQPTEAFSEGEKLLLRQLARKAESILSAEQKREN
jgi:GAF domain-containing protein